MNKITSPSEGRSPLVLLTVLLLSLGLAACASSPPKRTPYSGPDNVGAADPSALIGIWSGRVLNPIEGENEDIESAVYSYAQDGSWTAKVVSNGNRGFPFEMRGVGVWSAEGDMYNIQVQDVEFISDNPAMKLMSKILSKQFRKQSGNSNPYEISANRIVMVSEHQQAIELTRQ